jgi:antitoxin (DNA-binding transcriptional repressor) of toxin-antitoxin stability system
MKELAVEHFVSEVTQVLDDAQKQRILLTRNGAPVALLVGIENKDDEDLRLEESAEFWQMIEQRRKEPTIGLEELRAELEQLD